MLKKPRSIRLLDNEISVTYRRVLPYKGLWGYLLKTEPAQIWIKINENWPHTLNHEIFHAIFHFTGLSAELEKIDPDLEERIVLALEKGMKSLVFIEK